MEGLPQFSIGLDSPGTFLLGWKSKAGIETYRIWAEDYGFYCRWCREFHLGLRLWDSLEFVKRGTLEILRVGSLREYSSSFHWLLGLDFGIKSYFARAVGEVFCVLGWALRRLGHFWDKLMTLYKFAKAWDGIVPSFQGSRRKVLIIKFLFWWCWLVPEPSIPHTNSKHSWKVDAFFL